MNILVVIGLIILGFVVWGVLMASNGFVGDLANVLWKLWRIAWTIIPIALIICIIASVFI